MAYELILTEKPNAAKKIADALATGKAIKEAVQGVPYYRITHGKHDIVVASAVGHLYTVAEKTKSFKYPSFDIHWVATDEAIKGSFTKKYRTLLQKLAKQANEFTIATDYDIEGEVIGWNVLRYACNQATGNRMKFSTLTPEDLKVAYDKKLSHLDWGQAKAGETRHFLDWMYGINLSRALTLAMKNSGMYRTMSSGRVQGPALKLIVDKEREINAFKPVPFWEITANITLHNKPFTAMHKEEKFWKKQQAEAAKNSAKGNGTVTAIDKTNYQQAPPFPFDLTTLQTESYRLFGISPKDTLAVAQALYVQGFISYPRTSSQQLPKEINYHRVMSDLKKQSHYKEMAESLLKTPLLPNNGKKTDPAHPAIYPTGIAPRASGRDERVYDLIVKRFLACFSTPAERETVTITIEIGNQPFTVKGSRTTVQGWHKYYEPYVRLEEQELPGVKKGDKIDVKEILMEEKATSPPKRFTPASIIKELEKRNLGTKATRAEIVDALFQRGYVQDTSIKATEFGIKTIETLEKFCPEIIDEKLTRHFEYEMERIREKHDTESHTLEDAKESLTKLLKKFKEHEKEIGESLQDSVKKSQDIQNTIGPCFTCKTGTLKIIYSPKIKKRFIGCSNYPECKFTQNLPMFGVPRAAQKNCPQCGAGMVSIIGKRRKQDLCFNPNCPSRKEEREAIEKLGTGEKKCPKCHSILKLRKSVYGVFLGCSNFPKCRYLQRLDGTTPKRKFEKKPDAPVEAPAPKKEKKPKKAPAKKKASKKKRTFSNKHGDI